MLSFTRRPRIEGQATVEFALTLPIFILVLIGLFGMAVVIFSFVSTYSAAREGARYLISNPTASDSDLMYQICATNGTGLGGSQTASANNFGSGKLLIHGSAPQPFYQYEPLSVAVTYTVPLPTMSIPLSGGRNITVLRPILVSSMSTMSLEQ